MSLRQVLESVPDPRDPRGVRHRLSVVLTCAVGAVLAGARTWVGVSEWTADADREALSRLGIDQHSELPSESTIRRTLAGLDGADLDARVSAWMRTRVGQVAGRRLVAVDGKSMRGAGLDGAMPHLVSALDHDHGVVLAQAAVPDKGSEIPALRDLLDGLGLDGGLDGAVITADALHCQRQTAAWVTDAGADYVLTVKGNQAGLLRALKALPWGEVPGHSYVQTGHGRRVRRTVKAVAAPAWVDFPGANQVVQVRRTRTVNGRKRTEVVYAISSVPMEQAGPPVVAAWIQGHWRVENALHWVRDVVFDEDRHQLRVGSGPHVMATLRNTAISLLRLTGCTSIAASLRHHARDSARPVELLRTA